MIEVMIVNSMAFLLDLAAWLVTPVPLVFITLFILVFVFQQVGRLLHG